MNLRKHAANQTCQIRLPGCNSEPTCLAHYRLIGVSGMGMKPPDLLGSWACDHCHKIVDTDKSVEVQLAFAHGVFRTQAQLIRDGLLSW